MRTKIIRDKEALTATQDRLIPDETRRMKGEFYTPTIWVDEAHKMISEQFGEDWKEDYVVWDCSCGTGNLTRDYKFKELYCSTLNGSDIETMEQSDYNPEATKFQYDFLNDGIIDGKIDIENDEKLPDGLKSVLLEGKEIIFFINPPYGESKGDSKEGKIDEKSTNTLVSNIMYNDKLDYSTRQLYTQFLYKIQKLSKHNNIHIAIFSNGLYKTSVNFKTFRTYFFNNYDFKSGMIFNASNFSNVSSGWGIDFSIWRNDKSVNKYEFEVNVIQTDDDKKMVDIEKIIQYNTDNNVSASDWIRSKVKGIKLVSTIQVKTALQPSQSNVNNIIPNSLGYLLIKANKVKSNTQEVGLYCTATSNRGGVSLTKDNFIDGLSLFTARKSVQCNWINVNDEYLAPNKAHSNYKQFENDSIVYSLFNSHSQQGSMRQVEYKDKLWDIKNEFFFMSKDEMKQLAESFNFYELYKDVKTSDDRYVYNLLKTTNLSPDAQDVLETARELIRKSFEWRKIMHTTNPEYHLQSWDAGWYQIKKVLNEYFKDDLKSFNKKYKAFEDRLRPQVYELGFLKDGYDLVKVDQNEKKIDDFLK